jgi:hypothetical protein
MRGMGFGINYRSNHRIRLSTIDVGIVNPNPNRGWVVY